MGIGDAWFSCGSARWLRFAVDALDLCSYHPAKYDRADAVFQFVATHPDTSKHELEVATTTFDLTSPWRRLIQAVGLFRGPQRELCNKIRDIYTDAVDAELRSRHGVGLIDIPTIQSSDRTKETT
jgi:hypothetical protein